MTLIALDNAQWGFESNCFVCERSNERGLRIPFFHDAGRQIVTATFALSEAFSGAPTWVHGGIVLAVLDEAMAWGTIAIANQFAATRETTTTFERPVLVGATHRIEATVLDVGEELVETGASITDERDRVCASARATFVILGEAQVQRAVLGTSDRPANE